MPNKDGIDTGSDPRRQVGRPVQEESPLPLGTGPGVYGSGPDYQYTADNHPDIVNAVDWRQDDIRSNLMEAGQIQDPTFEHSARIGRQPGVSREAYRDAGDAAQESFGMKRNDRVVPQTSAGPGVPFIRLGEDRQKFDKFGERRY